MKCCEIHAGKFRSLLAVQRRVTTADGIGGNTETWSPDPPEGVWAELKATRTFSGERFAEQRLTPLNRFTAVTHFRGDSEGAPYYSANDRVVYKGRTYGIESVVDVEDRQQYLLFTLVEGQAT